MNTKTEDPVATKVVSEAKTNAKTAAPEKVETPVSEPSQQAAQSNSPSLGQVGASTSANALPPEIIELLSELRDTVKGLNPRRHTAKTLRRALSNVSAILADIDKLYQQD